MPTSDAQKRAREKYRQKTKRITIEFPPSQEDLWDFIQEQEETRRFIKYLIREAMEKSKKNTTPGDM